MPMRQQTVTREYLSFFLVFTFLENPKTSPAHKHHAHSLILFSPYAHMFAGQQLGTLPYPQAWNTDSYLASQALQVSDRHSSLEGREAPIADPHRTLRGNVFGVMNRHYCRNGKIDQLSRLAGRPNRPWFFRITMMIFALKLFAIKSYNSKVPPPQETENTNEVETPGMNTLQTSVQTCQDNRVKTILHCKTFANRFEKSHAAFRGGKFYHAYLRLSTVGPTVTIVPQLISCRKTRKLVKIHCEAPPPRTQQIADENTKSTTGTPR